jgi:uncharacterized membrane protein YvlD (DUF360 family)
MIGFLCLFFPSVIAVAITAKIRREIFRFDQYLLYYGVFTVIINGIMFWILSFMFEQHSISASDVFTTSFSAKYISLSSIFAVVFAYIAESLRKIKSQSSDLNQEKEIKEDTDKDN